MLTIDTEKNTASESAAEVNEAREEISESLKSISSLFASLTIAELEDALMLASDRNEKILYRTLLNLKMQLDQEKIINQTLLG